MIITDLARDSQGRIKNPWRADLQPASFRRAHFHVEASGIENGRRIVMHEFPKKDTPYAEDMGQRPWEFTIRGYCIQYPRDHQGAGLELYRRDYRIARDILAEELSSGQPGPLRLPTFKKQEITVVCPRYRLAEEERMGGYCVFDMTFVEHGSPPRQPQLSTRDTLVRQFLNTRNRAVSVTNGNA